MKNKGVDLLNIDNGEIWFQGTESIVTGNVEIVLQVTEDIALQGTP